MSESAPRDEKVAIWRPLSMAASASVAMVSMLTAYFGIGTSPTSFGTL